MSSKLAKYWITADEYERMGVAGIFGDARLELIEGEIYEMSPIGSPHAACVNFLSQRLNRLLGDELIVTVQNPIRLNDFSEPQPDLAVVRGRDDFYRGSHPTPADVLLLIEVADSTVAADRSVKVPLYALAGIREVWLVNLLDERVEIYSAPSADTYQQVIHAGRGEEARSTVVQELVVSVSELLG